MNAYHQTVDITADTLRLAAVQLERELMERPGLGVQTRAAWAVQRLYAWADSGTIGVDPGARRPVPRRLSERG